MNSRYNAADIEVLSGLDPVKRRPGMYTDTTRPNHLAQEVVESSEEIRVRDQFSKLRLAEGKYTSGEIDVPHWREDIETDFQSWKRANPT